LAHWKIAVAGCVCLDVGASTGGFTDCLLQHGAQRVIAIDTGYGQIHMKLRQDDRVRLLEKTNARYIKAEDIGGTVDLVVVDVSFISATLVMPAVIGAAFPPDESRMGKQLIVLVKPQFEVGREQIGKGGIVRDEAAQISALEKVRESVVEAGPAIVQDIDSPILGAEGNREFLLYAKF
jgi:23S rRNA (cytidine1920-2'-O)/16S rRNA (cytidine1409-2'-O)-methyltransferase